jgi:hypothetical protein
MTTNDTLTIVHTKRDVVLQDTVSEQKLVTFAVAGNDWLNRQQAAKACHVLAAHWDVSIKYERGQGWTIQNPSSQLELNNRLKEFSEAELLNELTSRYSASKSQAAAIGLLRSIVQ